MSPNSNSPTSLYGDGRVLALPDGWQPVEDTMFDTALNQATRAFTGGHDSVEHAVDRLSRYYAPNDGTREPPSLV